MSFEDKYHIISKVEFAGKTVKLKKPIYVKDTACVSDVADAMIRDPYYAFKLIAVLNKESLTVAIGEPITAYFTSTKGAAE